MSIKIEKLKKEISIDWTKKQLVRNIYEQKDLLVLVARDIDNFVFEGIAINDSDELSIKQWNKNCFHAVEATITFTSEFQ